MAGDGGLKAVPASLRAPGSSHLQDQARSKVGSEVVLSLSRPSASLGTYRPCPSLSVSDLSS